MMRLQSVTARVCLIGALSGLAGCFSLSRESPALEHYVLSAARTVEAPASADQAGISLGMRRLDMAAYLASPFIVVRRGAHMITTSDYHRWGEELAHGASRAVASHLAAAAPIRAVNIAPWPVRTDNDYLLQLHLSRFEGVADSALSDATGAAHVAASWEIIRPGDGAVAARGATDYQQQGWRVGDYAALVVMLETGLAGIARDIVSCVQLLGAAPQAPAAAAAVQELPLVCASTSRGALQ